MSHIHIPDGVIAPVWLFLGFLLTGIGMAFSLYKLRDREPKELVPKLGVVCALVLLAMSVPLGPIPAHLNLTVFMGIVLGPWLGFIAAFIINLLLGFVGHGGLSVVGINTILIGMEALIGYGVFTWLNKQVKVVRAAALTVALTLIFTNGLMLGVVAFAGLDPAQVIKLDEHGHEHDGEHNLPWSRLALTVLPIAGTGILLETAAVYVLVNFILKIRPDILGQVPLQNIAEDLHSP